MNCPICMESLTNNIQICSCSHKFHKECLNDWKQMHETCPICRHDISNDLETPEYSIDEWHHEFAVQHVNALFKIFNNDQTPASPEIINEFIAHNKEILKILAEKNGDPVIACNKIMREEIMRYQSQRAIIEKQKDMIESLENERKITDSINEQVISYVSLKSLIAIQQQRIRELEDKKSSNFIKNWFKSNRVSPH